MFVYLFNFIAMFQPYYCNFFCFSFLPRYAISCRLLCGQGLMMACVQSVFFLNKRELEQNNNNWNLQ